LRNGRAAQMAAEARLKMAEIWELICHHTYTGIPGVVVDLSPADASNGTIRGLDGSDFLSDGAKPGSGAVMFYKEGSVFVPTDAAAWQLVNGVKCEVVLRYRGPSVGDDIADWQVLDSDSFKFHIRSGSPAAWFSTAPTQQTEVDALFDQVGPQPYNAPTGQWITLGFVHDGFATIELYADGQLIAQRSGTYTPVNPPGAAGLNIGNDRTLIRALDGEIDDVKIWRLNPHRFDQNFLARPLDNNTANCWKRFFQELEAALKQNPQCGAYLSSSLIGIIQNLYRQALAKGPETTAYLLNAANRYDQLWRKGDVGGADMAKLFTGLIAWLNLVGLSPESNSELAALVSSDCMKLLLAGINSPDCDPQAKSMLQSIVNSLSALGSGPAA
jgi:hypothetical protein